MTLHRSGSTWISALLLSIPHWVSAARWPGTTSSSLRPSAAARPNRACGCPLPRSARCKAGRISASSSRRATTRRLGIREHGILTFRYTEPMTWWMPMPKEMPRTLEAALAEARRLAGKGSPRGQGPLHQRLPRCRGPLRRPIARYALVQRRGLEHELDARHRRRRDRLQEQVEPGRPRRSSTAPSEAATWTANTSTPARAT